MLKKIHHIGIIFDNLENKIKKFEEFGLHCSQLIENKEKRYRIAFFPIGEVLIEFISYASNYEEQDHLTKIVTAHKNGINHICFEVDDIKKGIQNFERGGARLIEGYPTKGITGEIAFFYPETTEGILIELNQSKK